MSGFLCLWLVVEHWATKRRFLENWCSAIDSRRRTKVVVGKWRASEKRKCKCRPLPWR